MTRQIVAEQSGDLGGKALPARLRARVWIEARHFFWGDKAEDLCWLWLLRHDGRVLALRMRAAGLGWDDGLAHLLARIDANPEQPIKAIPALGTIHPLPDAPVVPVPRWKISWGHPLQRAIRQFAGALDGEVLAALGRLEVPGPFFGSTSNYNRLASLPQPVRRHRLQAMCSFPPLVAPLLLNCYDRPDMFGSGEFQPEHRARCSPAMMLPVLDAMDRGRDLIGALADQYRVSRALVRSPPLREPWARGVAPRKLLRLLDAIPAHARPRTREAIESRLEPLAALPVELLMPRDTVHLANVFANGWDKVWQRVESDFQPLRNNLHDTRDFLRAALDQTELPGPLKSMNVNSLALYWVARRGLVSLLQASRRWHAQQPVRKPASGALPSGLAPLFGTWGIADGRAIELTTRHALFNEGETMHHCVGDYWHDCVLQGIRFVHLELPDSETGTARYDLGHFEHRLRFRLTDLRGPCNEDCSQAMRRFALQVEARLNADDIDAPRRRLLNEAAKARVEHRVEPRPALRALDRRSRDELQKVLGYCQQQADWHAQLKLLYLGPVAGFAYSEGPELLAQLDACDDLELVRERQNPHDPLAVRIDWKGHKLGYLPRDQNGPVAEQLDGGNALAAFIAAVHSEDPDSWEPVSCAIMPAEV